MKIESVNFTSAMKKTPPYIYKKSVDIRERKIKAGYIPTKSDKWIPTGLSTIATVNY